MNLPRRNRVDQMFPAELAIREAVLAVERLGADVKLTEAVILLQQAKDKVADYVDEHRVELAPRCFFFGCWNRAGHYLFGGEGVGNDAHRRGHVSRCSDQQGHHMGADNVPLRRTDDHTVW